MRGSWLVGTIFFLMGAAAFAQRGGGSMGGRGGQPGGGHAAPALTADEKARAQTAAEWADVIEKARSRVPQHPPDSVIHFPSKNATFIATLKFAEAPREELDRYLEKLWKSGTEEVTRRGALAGLWQEAEKPLWIRPIVEEFFRKRSGGASLRPEPEVAEVKADGKAADGKAADGKAADGKAVEVKAAKTDAKSADSKSADPKSADSKSADSKSADSKSADSKSADSKSADSKSVDSKSVDSKSADSKGPAQ